MGFLDIENFVCQTCLNRSDLSGPPDYSGDVAPRPWFRPALAEAHDKIQKPYYKTGSDGKKELVFGGNWRGMEATTEGADPVYSSATPDGIPYPAGYRDMRYVYIINPTTGVPHKRPLKSVSETEYNTQFGPNNGWGWQGYWGWGWDEWCLNGCGEGSQVRWMDKNGKFYLTHTPGPTHPALTLRMTYNGIQPEPTILQYTDNLDDWFTLNLFYELAALTTAIMWEHQLEGDNAKAAYEKADRMLGDAWKLNQGQRAGSNNRVFVQERRNMRGW